MRIVVGKARMPKSRIVLPEESSRIGNGRSLPPHAFSLMSASFGSSSAKVFAPSSWNARISNRLLSAACSS